MVDNKRPLNGSSADFSPKSSYGETAASVSFDKKEGVPVSPSHLFSGAPISSTPMGTFLLKKKEAPSTTITTRLQGAGPLIGKEIAGKRLTPEDEKAKGELSRRLLSLKMRQQVVFDLLDSSGLGDSYENLDAFSDAISERLDIIEHRLKKPTTEILNETEASLAREEDILEDIYTKTLLELSTAKPAAPEVVTKLQEELFEKEQVNALLKKIIPVYGRIDGLITKTKELSKDQVPSLEVLTQKFETLEQAPTEKGYREILTLLEKEEESLALLMGEVAQ